MNHERRWLGIFQLDRGESACLEKMTKSRVAKRSSEKVSLEVLEKEIKSQLLGPPKRGKSAGDFLEGNLKKRM